MSGLRDAVGFLTRIPVTASGAPGRSAVVWFPLVAAGIGGLSAAGYALAYQMMPSPLAALVAIVIGLVVTGAFHEDGLADTADALGSRREGEAGLEIMKDSRLGTYGTIALVVSIAWRVLAVGALSPVQALVGLVMAHTLGRTAALALMAISPPARDDGLARAGMMVATGPGTAGAVFSGCLVAALVGGWWLAPALGVAGLWFVWLRTVSVSRFSGVTGDVLGACEQLVEIGVLTSVVVLTWAGAEVWWLA